MSDAHRRPKAPDFVRERILDAAAELLSDGTPVSIGTVAEVAGVSKGAVQHHFGTRDDLFASIYDACLEQLSARLACGKSDKSAAWEYATAVLDLDTAGRQDTWRALVVAAVIDRAIAHRWSAWVAESRKRDPDLSARHLVGRLAADGLWLSDILGIYNLSNAERAKLSEEIQRLTDGKA